MKTYSTQLFLHVHDTLHAHELSATHAHVPEVPVLAGLHIHHLASVVGLLVHQPVTFHHVAGQAFIHAETLLDVVTVLHQLLHLTSKVLPLVDPHPVGSSVHGDHTARPDAVPHSHHAHVVSILAPPHEILVSHVVGAVVDHEAAALHPAGVAPAQEGGHIRAVAHALIGTALEVPLLVEDDLAHGHSCCVAVPQRTML